MQLLLSDLDIAARTLYGEIRNGTPEQMENVAHVLINRWNSTSGQFAKDDTLATTCLRHRQFSSWNKGDANLTKIFSTQYDNNILRNCLEVMLSALRKNHNLQEDKTIRAKHYHTKAIPTWTSYWPPTWAHGHTPTLDDGLHLFYNDVD